MKIAIISTPHFGVPPPKYGGLEQVVWDVTRGLLDEGHKCVLFAPDESKVPRDGFLYRTGKATNNVNIDWVQAEKSMWEKYDRQLDNFDIVWANDWFGFEYLSKMRNSNLKVCHTHHGGLNDVWTKTKPPFKLNMIAISNWMKRVYESQGILSQVSYNPVDLEKYKFQKNKGDRLLFVGRLDIFKQPHVAIKVAKSLHMGLDIVGGSFVQDQAWVDSNILSQVDMNLTDVNEWDYQPKDKEIVVYLDASHKKKISLYQNARAVLFPSRMGEPFGLIVPEANACGTPVIGLRDGAIPETIDEGNSGFVVGAESGKHSELADVNALIDGMLKLESSNITPEKCRANAERFSIAKTADRYEFLFNNIINSYEW